MKSSESHTLGIWSWINEIVADVGVGELSLTFNHLLNKKIHVWTTKLHVGNLLSSQQRLEVSLVDSAGFVWRRFCPFHSLFHPHANSGNLDLYSNFHCPNFIQSYIAWALKRKSRYFPSSYIIPGPYACSALYFPIYLLLVIHMYLGGNRKQLGNTDPHPLSSSQVQAPAMQSKVHSYRNGEGVFARLDVQMGNTYAGAFGKEVTCKRVITWTHKYKACMANSLNDFEEFMWS